MEAAIKVRRLVGKARRNRRDLSIPGLKHLLDMTAQDAIVESLRVQGMSCKVVSEEGNCTIGGDGEYLIVLDPVDGTTNMARGLNPAVTSIAISKTRKQSGVFAGLVMNLFNGEYYCAEKDSGAFHGDSTITTSPTIDAENAMLSIDISKQPRLEKLGRLLELNQHLRLIGCAAMSLCHVASGSVDAHVDLRGILRATDVSAGLLILKEAGGIYSIDGETFGDMTLARETDLELMAANESSLMEELRSLTE